MAPHITIQVDVTTIVPRRIPCHKPAQLRVVLAVAVVHEAGFGVVAAGGEEVRPGVRAVADADGEVPEQDRRRAVGVVAVTLHDIGDALVDPCTDAATFKFASCSA